MSIKSNLRAALLVAVKSDVVNISDEGAADALTDLLMAFADAVRGPAPDAAEFAASTLVADETPALILAELRKQTTLIEVLAKQGEHAATADIAILRNTAIELRKQQVIDAAMQFAATDRLVAQQSRVPL